MTNLLKRGAEWLRDQLEAHASETITYRRGKQSVPLSATLGSTEMEEETEHGIVHRFTSRDFLVTAASLILGGQATLPRRGDRIEHGGQTFQVLPDSDAPHYEPADSYGLRLRIHTKQITD